MEQGKFVRTRVGVKLRVQIHKVGGPLWLVVTHGVGEHLERHQYMEELFGDSFNICRYDLRGHGQSSGKKAYISDFRLFEQDLGEVLSYLRRNYKMNRYVLFGHSMGALICAGYLRRYVSSSFYPESVFLSAPPVGFYGFLGAVIKRLPTSVLYALARIPVSVALADLVDLDSLSHNPEVKKDYIADPQVSLKLHSKLILEMVKASRDIFSHPLNINCPGYVIAGGDDRVVNVPYLEYYFTEVEKKFELRIFRGAYHELHIEIEKYRTPYLEFLKDSICKAQR